MKIQLKFECIILWVIGGYCWGTAFLDEKYIYMVLFFSFIFIYFVAKGISREICGAISDKNVFSRMVDVELCKILHAISKSYEKDED